MGTDPHCHSHQTFGAAIALYLEAARLSAPEYVGSHAWPSINYLAARDALINAKTDYRVRRWDLLASW